MKAPKKIPAPDPPRRLGASLAAGCEEGARRGGRGGKEQAGASGERARGAHARPRARAAPPAPARRSNLLPAPGSCAAHR